MYCICIYVYICIMHAPVSLYVYIYANNKMSSLNGKGGAATVVARVGTGRSGQRAGEPEAWPQWCGWHRPVQGKEEPKATRTW